MAQIQFTSIAAKAEAWRIKRAAQAGQSWHLYRLVGSTRTTAQIAAPPRIEADGTVSSEHYCLDMETRRCSCGDQFHIDRLNREIRAEHSRTLAAGLEVAELECKHFTVHALLIMMLGEVAATQQIAQPVPVKQPGYWDEWEIDKRLAERQGAEAAKAKQYAEDWL